MSLPDCKHIHRQLASLLDHMIWSETEIESAQRRHPDAADRIWRSFTLLKATHPLMRTEAVYRAHCRELLERVAHGEDTRPGTAAECCIALAETSLRVPLSTSAAGLYARLWRLAGLPPDALSDANQHYEALEGSRIDEQEGWLRAHLRQPWRVLSPGDVAKSTPPR